MRVRRVFRPFPMVETKLTGVVALIPMKVFFGAELSRTHPADITYSRDLQGCKLKMRQTSARAVAEYDDKLLAKS